MQVFLMISYRTPALKLLHTLVHGVQTTGRHQNVATETGMETRMETQTEMGTGM